ncbi:MAG: SnoaL-like domain-containing protein [Nocardioidaceae bacterium]|nr:SnoaL-like domain-containing protein [Nocardioidaceae bacterium]NUS52755.1 SnoaL-like domain-containing protein [Nocardioidaceae bacterium]
MTPDAFAESLVAAFAASDAAAYFAHFHPDATFLFHDTPGLVASRADYEALWGGWERDDGFRVLACESTDRRVQEHGDLAVFTHAVRTRRVVAGTEEVLHERETIVLRRDGGSWTCVHEHLSPDPGYPPGA